uniref:Uncharacterized protein n=1 Tax=Amphora coffeiformis TaxID=265554 RepID=A0A7S3LEZ0_9STRA|mmetsp:Transcript_11360/g.21686  ORF Transcript_11360/g.21686 Transcript_11360/m.21686 type:complete len:502 (+) Transcript_11360:72-1577(+)|eukprot:scaffold107_cov154-Amphora_coffeaeformis.AAC.3
MDPNEDPWDLLGVSREAATIEIKFAFRKLALQYHPDKQKTDADREAANDIFAKLSAAYEIVADPAKSSRWKVDEERRKQQHQHHQYHQQSSHAPKQQQPPARHIGANPPHHAQNQHPSHSPHAAPRHGVPHAQAPRQGATGLGGSSHGQGVTCLGGSSHHSHKAPRQGVPHGQVPGAVPHGQHPAAARPTGTPASRSGGSSHAPSSGSSHGTPHASPGTSGAKGGYHASPMNYYPSPQEVQNSSRGHQHPKAKDQPYQPTQAAHQQTVVKLYRDPFELFDKIMKEEFGDDYKTNKKSGWHEASGVPGLGSINPFKKKNENSHKEFKKLDADGDKTLSKNELSKYIQSHSELWTQLGTSLDLPVQKCVEIATNVAFALALKKADSVNTHKVDRDLTEAEFKYFHQTYILSEKGAHEYFLRTIFAVYDINKDGVLSPRELDRFLDVFYKARDTFKGSMRLPDRKSLNEIVRERCDKNHDGVLQFKEIRDLLEVAAVVTADRFD